MEAEEPLRISADFAYQLLDFRVEAFSQFKANGRVILDGGEILLTGFGMKDGSFHRPRICLAFANTSSAGTP